MSINNSDKPISVNLATSDSCQALESHPPLLSSRQLGWKNLNLNYYRYGNCETHVHTLEHHTIGLILDRGKVERKLDGVYKLETTTVGSVAIIPAQIEHWSAWKGIGRFMMLSILPEAIAQIDPDVVNPDLVELIPTFAKAKPDLLIQGVGMAIKQSLENNLGEDNFYIEHLSNAIYAHLLQHYCTKKVNFKGYAGGLSSPKLKQAVEYINDNLDKSIKLKDLAVEMNISQYYFSRLFRESIGISPHQYIIKQRVEKAKLLLVNTPLPLADLALKCGFSSQSQMTMHFRKLVGTTPKKYRDS